jgi:phosphopantetheinyl transferase
VNAVGEDWVLRGARSLLQDFQAAWDRWLHPRERQQFDGIRDRNRQARFLCGRLAAKQLLLGEARQCDVAPRHVDICSRSGEGRGTPPVVRIDGQPVPVHLSITHTSNLIAVAVSSTLATRVGIDVVEFSDANNRLLRHWLGRLDGRLLGGAAGLDPVHVWAAKEAAFKTLPEGTKFRPRRFFLVRSEDGRYAWRHEHAGQFATGSVELRSGTDGVLAIARRCVAVGNHFEEIEFNRGGRLRAS